MQTYVHKVPTEQTHVYISPTKWTYVVPTDIYCADRSLCNTHEKMRQTYFSVTYFLMQVPEALVDIESHKDRPACLCNIDAVLNIVNCKTTYKLFL